MTSENSYDLSCYDFSLENAYAVTIGTHDREFILADFNAEEIQLNETGELVRQCWLELPKQFPHIQLDEFIIMPNQLQGIIHVHRRDTLSGNIATLWDRVQHGVHALAGWMNPFPMFGGMIRHFKAKSTYLVHQNISKTKVWQRQHFEHVVRNEEDLKRIREHIATKPSRWKLGLVRD